jgi:hypothetical protein
MNIIVIKIERNIKMNTHEFTLRFKLESDDTNPEIYIEKLYEIECMDATIGIGKMGYISLSFIREGNDIMDTLFGAISEVIHVCENCFLIEIIIN